MVTNAIKHADQRVIHISLAIRLDGLVTLKVRDFGIGLSPGVVAGHNYDSGRGMTLINARVDQLGAELRAENLEPGAQSTVLMRMAEVS